MRGGEAAREAPWAAGVGRVGARTYVMLLRHSRSVCKNRNSPSRRAPQARCWTWSQWRAPSLQPARGWRGRIAGGVHGPGGKERASDKPRLQPKFYDTAYYKGTKKICAAYEVSQF